METYKAKRPVKSTEYYWETILGFTVSLESRGHLSPCDRSVKIAWKYGETEGGEPEAARNQCYSANVSVEILN